MTPGQCNYHPDAKGGMMKLIMLLRLPEEVEASLPASPV